jgi:hypothetical protein
MAEERETTRNERNENCKKEGEGVEKKAENKVYLSDSAEDY